MFRFLIKPSFLLLTCFLLLAALASKTLAAEECPVGYTCPDTSFKNLPGEVIPQSRQKIFGGDNPSFSGNTGPKENKLGFPDYTQEKDFFADDELIKRSLPYELIEKGFPIFESGDLQGTIGHSGCGKVTVKGEVVGDAKIKQDKDEFFDLPISYDKLLLSFRFWESQYVSGKGASLKYKSTQPIVDPVYLENSGDCIKVSGVSANKTTDLNNPTPPSARLAGDIISAITGAFNSLLSTIFPSTTANFKVQQVKNIPGEQVFAESSNNFLNSFLPFEQTGQFVNQEEQKQDGYQVLGQFLGNEEIVGVPILGAKSTQDKSIELVKSLRPYEEARLITTLGPTGGLPEVKPPTPGLNYSIPYNNPDAVRLTQEIKNKVIGMVKNAWPNSKIAEQWDIVAGTAYASGINPAFAIALWIEESDASHYNNHFSCPPSESDFQKSFTCFINTTNNIQPPDWARWVRNYCGTPEGQTICTNDKNNHFIGNLKSWYDKIVPPGSPGAAQPL